MTPIWQWIFGISIAIGVLAAMVIKKFTLEISDEVDKDNADRHRQYIRHFYATSRYIYYLTGSVIFLLCFSAAGKKMQQLMITIGLLAIM